MGKKLDAVIAELEARIAALHTALCVDDILRKNGLEEALRLCLQEQTTTPPPVGEWTRDHEGREYFVIPWQFGTNPSAKGILIRLTLPGYLWERRAHGNIKEVVD